MATGGAGSVRRLLRVLLGCGLALLIIVLIGLSVSR